MRRAAHDGVARRCNLGALTRPDCVRAVLDARSWGSLHQKDADGKRTEPEQAAFDIALETMNTWYAHRLTTTVILSELPPGWPRSAEAAPFFPEGWLRGKGWPSFERAVSGMIKRGTSYSFRRIVDPAVPRGLSGGYRAPPMHPREFAVELSRKVFTKGVDCKKVAGLYADAFCAALGEARVLEFRDLEWKDADAEAFAKVLPLLRRVETLDLSFNKIGTRGFAALAAAIREGAAEKLKVFVFNSPNRMSANGDSPALKEACKAREISTPSVVSVEWRPCSERRRRTHTSLTQCARPRPDPFVKLTVPNRPTANRRVLVRPTIGWQWRHRPPRDTSRRAYLISTTREQMRRSRRTVDRLSNTIAGDPDSNPSPGSCTHAPCTHAHTQYVGSYPTLSPTPAAVGVARWGSVSAPPPFPPALSSLCQTLCLTMNSVT